MNRDPLPVVLIVLDGYGEAPPSEWNAIANSDPRAMRHLRETYPATLVSASGESVGLPAGQIGNSEVGHLCLGCGRVVLQDLPRISRAARAGEFDTNPRLQEAMAAACAAPGRTLHLMGLFSPGGVHSHIDHLRALVAAARRRGVPRVRVHAFLDGRDVPPKSALPWMESFEAELRAEAGAACEARVATVSGRFYAMDRDTRWDRVETAWRAIVHGEGVAAGSGAEAIVRGYERGETDEFVRPTVIPGPDGAPLGAVRPGDAIIHFNFRADRARELTRALALEPAVGFERGDWPRPSIYVCFTEYDKTFGLPVAFPQVAPPEVFGEICSRLGLRQVRMAETEKYAHVTYFFNGGVERPFEGEERVLIPSERKVATYDQYPQMSAPELTERALERIRSGADDFLLLNFANPDMVGHTGVYEAAVAACRVVDEAVGRIGAEVLARGGTFVVTADHGNCEQMRDPVTGQPHTAHTTNPVPCVFASDRLRGRRLREGGLLADVVPTLLDLLEVEKPAPMDGTSLLRR